MIGRPSSTEFEKSALNPIATASPGRRPKITRAPTIPSAKQITAPA